jgi:hypothetical protein
MTKTIITLLFSMLFTLLIANQIPLLGVLLNPLVIIFVFVCWNITPKEAWWLALGFGAAYDIMTIGNDPIMSLSLVISTGIIFFIRAKFGQQYRRWMYVAMLLCSTVFLIIQLLSVGVGIDSIVLFILLFSAALQSSIAAAIASFYTPKKAA